MQRIALAVALLAGCSFNHAGLPGRDLALVDIGGDAAADLADQGPGDSGGDGADLGPLDLGDRDSGPVLAPLAQDDGRLWLGLSSGGPLALMRYDGTSDTWSAESAVPPASGAVRYIRSMVLASEEIGVVKAVSGGNSVLTGHRHNALGWSVAFTHTNSGTEHEDKLDFDLAREALSGDLLLVHSDGTKTPVYRTFSGGQWSTALAVPTDLTGGRVLWVRLVARPGSDQIALLYADDKDDLGAVVWDGAQWDTASAKLLETALKVNPASGQVGNRCFDGAYETKTGTLLVAWGLDGVSKFEYATYSGGSWSGTSNESVFNGKIDFIQLARDPDPGSQKIAAVFTDLGNGTERLALGVWDGGSWIGTKEYDNTFRDVNDKATGDLPAAVAWVGATGKAVCVYSDNETGQIDGYTWTSGDWSKLGDEPLSGKDYTESVTLHSLAGRDAVLMVLSDSKSQVLAATYDGSSWTVPTGLPLTAALAHTDSVPFDLALKP